MEIKTANDWWASLDQHWSNILEIYVNVGAPLDDKWWSDGIGKEVTEHDKTLIATLKDAKSSRDHEAMHHFLQLVWMAAPDKSYIHSWPSWEAFCDLCSENWVFYLEQRT